MASTTAPAPKHVAFNTTFTRFDRSENRSKPCVESQADGVTFDASEEDVLEARSRIVAYAKSLGLSEYVAEGKETSLRVLGPSRLTPGLVRYALSLTRPRKSF